MKHLLPLLCISLLGLATSARAENPTLQFETNKGQFSVELYADKAPKSVDNFMRYVREGFYSGTVFHRVIPDFMLQGGGYTKSYSKKSTHGPITNEADNGLLNEHGTLAMARTGDPHSATSQFFINMADNDILDHQDKTPKGWGYAVFGKVLDGMDVLEKIQEVKTGAVGALKKNVPQQPIVIKQVTILSGVSSAPAEQAAADAEEVAESPKPAASAKPTSKPVTKPADSKINRQLDTEVKQATASEAEPTIDPYALYEPEPPDVPAVP